MTPLSIHQQYSEERYSRSLTRGLKSAILLVVCRFSK